MPTYKKIRLAALRWARPGGRHDKGTRANVQGCSTELQRRLKELPHTCRRMDERFIEPRRRDLEVGDRVISEAA